MKSSEILSHTDRTSWSRIAMVWRFYLPYTRRKLISFAALAVILEILMLLSVEKMSEEASSTLVQMYSTFITVLIGCSALVFAKPKGRALQAMLPALGMEKSIVIIGYVTVIIPLIVFIPSSTIAYLLIGNGYPAMTTLTSTLGASVDPIIFVYSVLFIESTALTCLWGVIASREKNAMRNGLLGAAGFYLATMLLTGLLSFGVGFYHAYTETEMDFPTYSTSLFGFLAVICGIYVIFALIKCCHVINRGQY